MIYKENYSVLAQWVSLFVHMHIYVYISMYIYTHTYVYIPMYIYSIMTSDMLALDLVIF